MGSIRVKDDVLKIINDNKKGLSQSEFVAQAVKSYISLSSKPFISDRGKGVKSISISLTKTEDDLLEQQAKNNGVSKSLFIASLIRDSVNLPLANDEIIFTLNRTVKQIRALGNNVNQIARFINRANLEERRKIIVDDELLFSASKTIEEAKKTITTQLKRLKRF